MPQADEWIFCRQTWAVLVTLAVMKTTWMDLLGGARSFSVAACIGFSLTAAAADSSQELQRIDPGPPPSDAIVLFDGKDLAKWVGEKGRPAQWKVENGHMTVNGTGSIRTVEEFGAVQLHIEWATPAQVTGEGQDRGNSGVYLQGRYEIQVLDSYDNKTYQDGHAGAFYGNFPPLVIASKKPGEWQSYDIIFHPPMPGPEGKGVLPGSFTVLHNGVLVQDHVPVQSSTTAAPFSGAVPKGPLVLQDHGNPVRYRNVWIRSIPNKK